jgi:hypothetical protein
MKHAITANLCPFCGNSIFDARELALRKSISRVLIKNGLDNDDVINRIVEDILALATGAVEDTGAPVQQAAPAQPAPPAVPRQVPRSAAERDAVTPVKPVEVRGEDGLTEAERNAPSRRLTPAPKPTAQTVQKAGGMDVITAAMRVFEDENADPMARPYDDPAPAASDDDDDASGIFFMEATAAAMEAERRKGVAAEAQQRTVRIPPGQQRTAPAFNRVS